MNLLIENIKYEFLTNKNKILLFSGSPIIKYNIKLIRLDNFKKKKINDMINIDENNFINSGVITKNSFFIFEEGYYFLNCKPMNKNLFFISSSSLFCNIFTTIISINKISTYIDEHSSSVILFKKIFNDFEEEIFLNKDLNSLFFYNFNKIFTKNKLCSHNLNVLMILIKLDVKLNFWLNLILKYNKDLDKNMIYNLYKFIWENIDKDLTKFNSLNINSIFNNLISNTEQYDLIIKNWFSYIDFCVDSFNSKIIFLLNISCAPIFLSFNDLVIDKINKDKFILTYINHDVCKGNYNIIGNRL